MRHNLFIGMLFRRGNENNNNNNKRASLRRLLLLGENKKQLVKMSFDSTAPPQGFLANCRLFTAAPQAYPRRACNDAPPVTWTHLVVHVQRVALPSGLEVLRVGVHAEVHLPVEALHVDRVPVLVVQQAAHGHRHAAAAEPRPAVVCGGAKQSPERLTRVLPATPGGRDVAKAIACG